MHVGGAIDLAGPVDVLVCRLRNKIDADFNVKLIHTMRGVGYVFRADE